jgi:phosphinothricin acetyltransferase
MEYAIIPMPPELWPAVREIYREGIATGNATFETELPDWDKWDNSHRKDCRLVATAPVPEGPLNY